MINLGEGGERSFSGGVRPCKGGVRDLWMQRMIVGVLRRGLGLRPNVGESEGG